MITQTAEYALRAIVYLGGNAGRPATTRQIAAATKVPRGYLSKVLQALGKAGLVDAHRGLHGGYVLARSLDDLSILDVVNAVDPVKRIDHCPLNLEAHREHLCSLHQRLDDAAAMIESFFRDAKVGQLLVEPNTSKPLCNVPPVTQENMVDDPCCTSRPIVP